MNRLVKIREVSQKYDITARTLRYYEDMGLIKSTRSDDYAYRLYDEEAIKRLEQILILRKLNISIKDIQLVFKEEKTSVLLDVLNKKISNIDDEVALLHELKEIVKEFINQIKRLDFHNEADVKLLYEKAKDIEDLVNVEYNGNPAPVMRLTEISEKLEKTPDIRGIELPKGKAARSGKSDLDEFDKWWSSIKVEQNIFPRDFMWFNPVLNDFEWLFIIPENLTDTNGYEVFDFPGGLYAVATAIDGEDINRVNRLIHQWVDNSDCFEVSNTENDSVVRYDMGHIITPEIFYTKMGYHLMDLYVPIVVKQNSSLLMAEK